MAVTSNTPRSDQIEQVKHERQVADGHFHPPRLDNKNITKHELPGVIFLRMDRVKLFEPKLIAGYKSQKYGQKGWYTQRYFPWTMEG